MPTLPLKSPYAKPICAIDPGGTTGFAVLTPAPDHQLHTMTFKTMRGSLPPRKKVEFTPTEFFKFLKAVDWQLIIIENFVADNMINAFGLYTVQLVGAVKMFGFMTNTPVYVQMPQFRYSSKKQMETLLAGRKPTPVIHERDATMHLLAYLEKGPQISHS